MNISENVMISKAILSKLIDMAMEHARDIVSGIEDGTYAAAENKDIGAKWAAVNAAQMIYAGGQAQPAPVVQEHLQQTDRDRLITEGDVTNIGHVMVQALVGDYDTPDSVPEWKWLEENASYAHVRNGDAGGVWEFILNVARDFKDIPVKLQPAFSEAKAKDLAYVVFHQGT